MTVSGIDIYNLIANKAKELGFADFGCAKASEIKAYKVAAEGLQEFTLKLGELTDEERQIILKGCLINYNRVN